MKTLQQARTMIRPPVNKPRQWNPLKRRQQFGYTANQVRSNLRRMTWCGKTIYVHAKVVDSLERVEKRIREVEKARHWERWEPDRVDVFCWRPIRNGSSLSRHAHAIALDIDPSKNGYYPSYRPNITIDLPMRVIQAFIDEGWTWGGNWNKPCDPMHFQYA